jgi:hypothetical protein
MVASRQNKEAVVRTYRKVSASAVGCLLAAALAMTAGEARAFSANGAYGVSSSIGPGARMSVGDSPDLLGSDPLARAALDRRCPEILADPTWYDDDIIALCLQARKRRHAAADGER